MSRTTDTSRLVALTRWPPKPNNRVHAFRDILLKPFYRYSQKMALSLVFTSHSHPYCVTRMLPCKVACRAAEDVERLCRNHMGTVPPIEASLLIQRFSTTLTLPSLLFLNVPTRITLSPQSSAESFHDFGKALFLCLSRRKAELASPVAYCRVHVGGGGSIILCLLWSLVSPNTSLGVRSRGRHSHRRP